MKYDEVKVRQTLCYEAKCIQYCYTYSQMHVETQIKYVKSLNSCRM